MKKDCRFSAAACVSLSFDIDLIAGRYVADAKSILSVFGLDLDSEVTLGIHADEDEAAAYLGKIGKYLV